MVVLKEISGAHQSHSDYFSGNHECLSKASIHTVDKYIVPIGLLDNKSSCPQLYTNEAKISPIWALPSDIIWSQSLRSTNEAGGKSFCDIFSSKSWTLLLTWLKIHTKLFHPHSEHLHKSGQYIPSVERSCHRQVGVFKIGEIGDGEGRLRRIWRFEVIWHGIGQLSRGAYVKHCDIKTKIQTVILWSNHTKHGMQETLMAGLHLMHNAFVYYVCSNITTIN